MITRQRLLEGMRSAHASMVETDERQLDGYVEEVLRDGGDPEESMALRAVAFMMRQRQDVLASEIRRLEAGGEVGEGTIAAQFRTAMERLIR